jgi:hypothetical protein
MFGRDLFSPFERSREGDSSIFPSPAIRRRSAAHLLEPERRRLEPEPRRLEPEPRRLEPEPRRLEQKQNLLQPKPRRHEPETHKFNHIFKYLCHYEKKRSIPTKDADFQVAQDVMIGYY